MLTVRNPTSAPLSATCSLTQFSTESESLSNRVKVLIRTLQQSPESSRKAFEFQLNELIFEQMNLTSRVSNFEGGEKAEAQAKIQEIETQFDEADRLMCPELAPKDKVDIIVSGLVEGFVGGMVAGAVEHIATAILTPRIPVNSEVQPNALLASNADVTNAWGGPPVIGPCFPIRPDPRPPRDFLACDGAHPDNFPAPPPKWPVRPGDPPRPKPTPKPPKVFA